MSEAPLKATLKAGSDFDAPWLTVDGLNPDDLKFKLDGIQQSGVLESLVGAANMLKAVNNVQPLTAPERAPAQAAPQQPQGWGQPAPQQGAQQAPPQQQQRSQYAGTPHPEGKACEACGKTLEQKKTSGGKFAWRCPEWRWNNGTPNEHTSEWAS